MAISLISRSPAGVVYSRLPPRYHLALLDSLGQLLVALGAAVLVGSLNHHQPRGKVHSQSEGRSRYEHRKAATVMVLGVEGVVSLLYHMCWWKRTSGHVKIFQERHGQFDTSPQETEAYRISTTLIERVPHLACITRFGNASDSVLHGRYRTCQTGTPVPPVPGPGETVPSCGLPRLSP